MFNPRSYAARALSKHYEADGHGVTAHAEGGALTAEARNRLKASSFVFPKTRRYPIPDINHARNALARSSGKSEESAVRAAVYRKFPELRK